MIARLQDADDVRARRMTATAEARLIQALAAHRARTATARDDAPYSAARANAAKETRNG
ncbi:hypothetical protein [Streptomyces drozdowiczii]|uniref:hypothetical protein n=1 Tax=Streptomyces drozdowiczii TaxID=202862 RepID=UPI00403CA221